MDTKLKILIADDHPLFRKGLCGFISELPGMVVVKACENGIEAKDSIKAGDIDIAILDIDMPGMNGLQVATSAKDTNPDTKIVILTMYNEEDILEEALENGVLGFLLKENAVNEIADCLQQVSLGIPYITSKMSHYLIKKHSHNRERDWSNQLTSTEIQIIKHVANGNTTREIANILFVSPKTVENHRFNITKKIGLNGANSLLKFCLENKNKINSL